MSQVADPTPARTMSAMTVMKMRIAGASITELSPQVRMRMWY